MPKVKDLENVHPYYEEMEMRWRTARAFCRGRTAVLEDHEVLVESVPPLPGHWPGNRESGKPKVGAKELSKVVSRAYADYCRGAYFLPLASRARKGLAGMINANPPATNVPTAMEDWLQDVGAVGVQASMEDFSDVVVRELLSPSRVGVLVSWGDTKGMTDGEATRRGVNRPVLRVYGAEAIPSWRYNRVGTREVLSRVVLRETLEDEGDDEWQVVQRRRWRVLDLAVAPQKVSVWEDSDVPPGVVPVGDSAEKLSYRHRLYEEVEGGNIKQIGTDVWPLRKGKTLPWIPFELREVGDPGVPLLMEVVDVNAAHLRNSADHEHVLRIVGSPTPYVTGFTERDRRTYTSTPNSDTGSSSGGAALNRFTRPVFHLGTESFLIFEKPESTVKFLALGAEGVGALAEAMEAKTSHAVMLVGRLLAEQKRAAEAARTEEVRRGAEHGVLDTVSEQASALLTMAAKWATWWAGEDPSKVEIQVNRDYWGVPLAPTDALALAELWVKYGLLAKDDVRDLLRRGGVLGRDRTNEEIDTDVEEEPGGPNSIDEVVDTF